VIGVALQQVSLLCKTKSDDYLFGSRTPKALACIEPNNEGFFYA
jgi:hypothetical protein